MSNGYESEGVRRWLPLLEDCESVHVHDLLDNHEVRAALLILSRSGNGFVREAAVRELSAHVSVEALEALFERLNDWVPQVRRQAALALESYLVSDNAVLLLQALKALLTLAGGRRADHGDTLARVRSALLLAPVRQPMEEVFRGATGKIGRFLLGVLLEDSTARPGLLKVAVRHPDMSVRQLAVEACADLPASEALPLMEEAMRTSGASVRVKVLRVLLTLLDDPRQALRKALFDVSASMRNLAIWAAPRWQLDSRQVLLERLAGPAPGTRREWLGLIGLARDLNEPQADLMLARALHSCSLNVRAQALNALGERGVAQQVEALGDSSDKVFNTAVALLRKQPWGCFELELERFMDDRWYQLPESRRLRLLSLKPGWRQLEYLLRRHGQDASGSNEWLEHLVDYCARRCTSGDMSTPREVRQTLQRQLQALEEQGVLPKGSVDWLR
ncbi:HEAT repeat domain-containing protein [Pseudomonas sp. COR18]|uniref:HEAT repeat domain-containing protein n=1 Tax=Pseudomonas sp. COR18 TaxID=3399680 RepID=UPI003AFFD604